VAYDFRHFITFIIFVLIIHKQFPHTSTVHTSTKTSYFRADIHAPDGTRGVVARPGAMWTNTTRVSGDCSRQRSSSSTSHSHLVASALSCSRLEMGWERTLNGSTENARTNKKVVLSQRWPRDAPTKVNKQPSPKITWLSVDSIQPDAMDVGVERTFSPQNFSMFPWE